MLLQLEIRIFLIFEKLFVIMEFPIRKEEINRIINECSKKIKNSTISHYSDKFISIQIELCNSSNYILHKNQIFNEKEERIHILAYIPKALLKLYQERKRTLPCIIISFI